MESNYGKNGIKEMAKGIFYNATDMADDEIKDAVIRLKNLAKMYVGEDARDHEIKRILNDWANEVHEEMVEYGIN